MVEPTKQSKSMYSWKNPEGRAKAYLITSSDENGRGCQSGTVGKTVDFFSVSA